MVAFEELPIPGFYVDAELRVYFNVRDFLLCRGLPDNQQVRASITRGVLEGFHPTRIWLLMEA